MKTWQQEIHLSLTHPLTEELFTESTLFFDIETTGFSPKHTNVYLIGCAVRKQKLMCITQFFSESLEDEKPLLLSFSQLVSQYNTLITFNGMGFDIPYLNGRYEHYMLPSPFHNFTYLDIFKSISPYKHVLKLVNLKQKTLEQFLGLSRNDLYSGGDLINIYLDYVKSPNSSALLLLKLHNFEDVTGMQELLPILSFVQLFKGNFEL
ncbi:MAG: ribonuclease H-like domain-containing protein, partial [Lachnospiraceae bacterium]